MIESEVDKIKVSIDALYANTNFSESLILDHLEEIKDIVDQYIKTILDN